MGIYFGNFKVVKNYPIHPLPRRCILYFHRELDMCEHLHTCIVMVHMYKQLWAGGRREDAFAASIIS